VFAENIFQLSDKEIGNFIHYCQERKKGKKVLKNLEENFNFIKGGEMNQKRAVAEGGKVLCYMYESNNNSFPND
jgi:hypothetical protein